MLHYSWVLTKRFTMLQLLQLSVGWWAAHYAAIQCLCLIGTASRHISTSSVCRTRPALLAHTSPLRIGGWVSHSRFNFSNDLEILSAVGRVSVEHATSWMICLRQRYWQFCDVQYSNSVDRGYRPDRPVLCEPFTNFSHGPIYLWTLRLCMSIYPKSLNAKRKTAGIKFT